MTPEEGVGHLLSLPASSIKMGLERVREALHRLGDPQRGLPALHVAGTNGKGSTSAMSAACLEQGFATGLYTSPHLERLTERFRLRGEDVDEKTLGEVVAGVVRVLGVDHPLTFFELGTVVAFQLFRDAGMEVVVLEVGMGGRLDATTACEPAVTAITPVDLDHQEYLGSTIEAIAGEKAGIIKDGVPVVCARQAPAALEVIRAGAGDRLRLDGRDFTFDGHTYRGWGRTVGGLAAPLAGPHQVGNTAVALACVEAMGEAGFPLSDAQVRAGLAATRWPGRLEIVPGSPEVVLDGAHNPAGAKVLAAALDERYPTRAMHLVFGAFRDKDIQGMLAALAPAMRSVVLTPLEGPRSWEPAEHLAAARRLCDEVVVESAAWPAVERARAAAGAGGVVVVAGSFTLVGQVRAALARAGSR